VSSVDETKGITRTLHALDALYFTKKAYGEARGDLLDIDPVGSCHFFLLHESTAVAIVGLLHCQGEILFRPFSAVMMIQSGILSNPTFKRAGLCCRLTNVLDTAERLQIFRVTGIHKY
jgi:hypothetical protein